MRTMIKPFLVILLIALFPHFHIAAQPPAPSTSASTHYSIRLKLEPEAHYIGVSTLIRFVQPKGESSTIQFYLHKQMEIASLSGPDVASFRFDKETPSSIPYFPMGRLLEIELKQPLKAGQATQINIEYDGYLTQWPEWSPNIITKEWTEIGLYLPWYPYNPAHGDFLFDMAVTAPAGYTIASFGPGRQNGNSIFFNCNRPVNDIVVVASRFMKLERLTKTATNIRVFYSTIKQETALGIADDLANMLQLYETWFGGNKNKDITLVESARTRGGGYARPGLIVLGNLSDTDYTQKHASYIRYLAHEAAHIWWRNADTSTWEDWMNEGFAEYSALLVIEKVLGAEEYNTRIKLKEREIKGIPPIWGFDRSDRSTPATIKTVELLLYSKAPLVLAQLRRRLRHQRYLDFCKTMVATSADSTDNLLTLLKEKHGAGFKAWLTKMLKTF